MTACVAAIYPWRFLVAAAPTCDPDACAALRDDDFWPRRAAPPTWCRGNDVKGRWEDVAAGGWTAAARRCYAAALEPTNLCSRFVAGEEMCVTKRNGEIPCEWTDLDRERRAREDKATYVLARPRVPVSGPSGYSRAERSHPQVPDREPLRRAANRRTATVEIYFHGRQRRPRFVRGRVVALRRAPLLGHGGGGCDETRRGAAARRAVGRRGSRLFPAETPKPPERDATRADRPVVQLERLEDNMSRGRRHLRARALLPTVERIGRRNRRPGRGGGARNDGTAQQKVQREVYYALLRADVPTYGVGEDRDQCTFAAALVRLAVYLRTRSPQRHVVFLTHSPQHTVGGARLRDFATLNTAGAWRDRVAKHVVLRLLPHARFVHTHLLLADRRYSHNFGDRGQMDQTHWCWNARAPIEALAVALTAALPVYPHPSREPS